MPKLGRPSLLIAALSLGLMGFGSHQVAEPTDWERLLIEIGSAYSPLSECMQKIFQVSEESAAELMSRLAEQADVDAIERDAISVLGRSSPGVVAARGPELEPSQRIRLLLSAMAQAALVPDEDDGVVTKSEVMSLKALILGVIHIASVTNGRCAPSENLLNWMDEIPHADQ